MDQNHTTPTTQSLRIAPIDKELFVEISKQLGIPHHESFSKMVGLYKDMYALEDKAPERLAQVRELQGLFERLLGIYEEVFTGNEQLNKQMVEQHAKALQLKDQVLEKNRRDMEDVSSQKATLEETLKSKESEIENLKKQLNTARESLEKNDQLKVYKDALVESLQSELALKAQHLQRLEEEEKKRSAFLDAKKMTLEQLVTAYEGAIDDKQHLSDTVEVLKYDLKNQNDTIKKLKEHALQLELQNKHATTVVDSKDEALEALKAKHAIDLEQVKAEYKNLYESQIALLKETFFQFKAATPEVNEEVAHKKNTP